jgi:hypothetical protein
MKSTFILASILAAGLAANVPVSSPAAGRPLMHPELKSSQGRQSLVCYDGPNQTGNRIT